MLDTATAPKAQDSTWTDWPVTGGENSPPSDKVNGYKKQSDGENSPPDAKCQLCGKHFEPRKASGGKPQKFCSESCGREHHSQRGQRQDVGTVAADTAPRPKPENAPAATAKTTQTAVNKSAQTEALDFDWNADESVVLRHQPAVAIYINAEGGLTIRQERDWNEDGDTVIAVAPENIAAFVDRLTDIIGVPSFP